MPRSAILGTMRTGPWREIADRQAGMLSRRQLNALGVTHNAVRRQVEAGRWVLRTPVVVSTTTGVLTWKQRAWMGLLHAGPGCAVGGLSAARLHGLRHWDRDDITILVDEDAEIARVDGLTFVRTRRDIASMLLPGTPAPVCRIEPALLLFAGYDRSARTACGVLAAAVQQRLTTPGALLEWIDRMRPLRRARLFRSTLHDISGGAESLAEIDIGRVCRRFGPPLPQRQVRRWDAQGRRRFTDCEWTLPDGRVVVLEVDGAFHMEAEHWVADMSRERSLVADGSVVLRCTSLELRRTPEAVVRDLRAVGVGRADPRRGCQPSV